MFTEEWTAVSDAAKIKLDFLRRNPFGYFVASLLAGLFVGFGVLTAFTAGGLLAGLPYARIVTGAAFGMALSLVVMAGAELFTGNNMVMAAGMFARTVKPRDVLILWAVCYIGNWAGSVLLAAAFFGTGLASGPVGEFMAAASEAKMNLPFVQLFLRGVLCNILVCLAVWCAFRCKSESGKLIMVFWCLFAFVVGGFEHSIANMTLLTVSLLAPFETAVGFGGYLYNILVATLGNIVGGALFVAAPYYCVQRGRK